MPEPLIQKILRRWHPGWNEFRFRATLVGIVAGAVVVPLLFAGMPFFDLFNDMAVQPRGHAQGHYGFYSGQQLIAEQPAVPGTIPMHYDPYPYEGKDEKTAKLAGEKLTSPIWKTGPEHAALRRSILERGQTVFKNVCITCHGPEGRGDGTIQGPGLFPAPPSFHTDGARGLKDGRIFHIITRGQNKMPGYADKLTPADRWAAVHFVRALQLAETK